MMIERCWFAGFSYRSLQFLALAEADYLDLICREVDLPVVARSLAQTIARLHKE